MVFWMSMFSWLYVCVYCECNTRIHCLHYAPPPPHSMMDETVSKRQVAGRRGALLRGRSFNKLKPARAIDSIVRANRSIRCARQTNADIAAAVRARRQSVQADVPSGGDSSEEEYVSSSEPQSESDGSFTPVRTPPPPVCVERERNRDCVCLSAPWSRL